jgi:gamma-glutamylcyclotransferase (GGCT)/AIG2-like uncharacterized protein YtfP
MISDRLFVYGTLMRGFDHPMAQLLVAQRGFSGRRHLPRPALPHQALSGAGALGRRERQSCSGELYRLRDRDALARRVRQYEA